MLAIVVLCGTLLAWWLFVVLCSVVRPSPLADVPPADGGTDVPVSILVAVRNEVDRRLTESLRAMLAQRYPSFEIIAVDDHSTDASLRILQRLSASAPTLRLLSADPSHAGKRAALTQAAAVATGSWLLFTDADAILQPDALQRGMRYVREQGVDALSLLPVTRTVSFWEQATLAATSWLVFAGGLPRRCNDDDAPVGLAAAGPYLLVRRSAYEAIGGYGAIEQNVLIDVALVRRLRAAGFRYRYQRSGGCVETRMYRSLGEIWEGFGKNAFTAVGARWPAALASGIGLAALVTLPWLALVGATVALAGGDAAAWPVLALAGTAVIAMLAVQWRGARFMGSRLRPTPLCLAWTGTLLWAAILGYSGWRTTSKRGVYWKARYLPPVNQPARP